MISLGVIGQLTRQNIINSSTGGGCTTLSDHVDGSLLQTINTQHYIAGFIDTPASSETICRIDANVAAQDFVEGATVTLEVWTFNSGTGKPGTFIVSSDGVNPSIMPTYPTTDWFTFRFSTTWSKVSGTDYVLVLHITDTAHISWATSNVGDPGHHTVWTSPDGSTWTPDDIGDLDRVQMREYK